MISGCPGTRRGQAGCRCSSPKRRPSVFCCSGLIDWSRKKSTQCSASAPSSAFTSSSSSGCARSMPRSSAPHNGVSFVSSKGGGVIGREDTPESRFVPSGGGALSLSPRLQVAEQRLQPEQIGVHAEARHHADRGL